MKWLNIAVIIALIVLAFIVGMLVTQTFSTTGQAIANVDVPDQTLTKAVCKGNECVDVLVSCKNGSAVSLELISDRVSFSEDWKDPRQETELCE